MVGVVCAMRWEGNPFIKHFGLKKDKESNKLDIYYNEDMALIISGIGMEKSSAATAFLYSKMMTMSINKEIQLFINVGVCGSLEKDIALGKCFLINKISNIYSKKDFYPDILTKHTFEEGTLLTYSVSVIQSSEGENSFGKQAHIKKRHSDKEALVDMEGAGFFESCSIFLPPHKISCIKVVSDIGSPHSVTRKFVEDIIERNMKDIEKFISNQKNALYREKNFSENEEFLIENVAKKMRLTTAHYHILYLLCQYKKNRKQSISCLNEYLSIDILDKNERSKVFEQLKDVLSS